MFNMVDQFTIENPEKLSDVSEALDKILWTPAAPLSSQARAARNDKKHGNKDSSLP